MDDCHEHLAGRHRGRPFCACILILLARVVRRAQTNLSGVGAAPRISANGLPHTPHLLMGHGWFPYGRPSPAAGRFVLASASGQ
jgi:hypothetical protein